MFSNVSKINGVKRLRSLKKNINDNLSGTKKNKKLSSKTAKYINYYFCKKKKADDKIAFNIEKKKKLEYTPSLFQVIYNIKDDKFINIKKCNILELNSGDKNEENKLNIIKNNKINTECFSNVSNASNEEVRDCLDNKINLNKTDKNEKILAKENYIYNKILQKNDMISIQPCITIRKDKMLKDLKNMDIINNIIDIKKNKDVCNIYLITSLINIYHENNYNYLILKIIKDMKYIVNTMNNKIVSLLLFNLYKYYITCYIKKIYEKDNIINFKSHFNIFYIIDHNLNNLCEQTYEFLNINVIKNFLISISYDIEKNLYCEKDMSILSKIIFVYSFFLDKNYKLFELLIGRIFKSLKIKKEKNKNINNLFIIRTKIENISLIALSFEKLNLYSSKFTFLHSYIILRKINRLIKCGEKLLLLNKKKKILKKKNLKNINLFPMHSRDKLDTKLPLINLKDIFIYLYIINKNNIKNNRFIISILKYAQIFFKANFENDKKNYIYSYFQNVAKKKKQINNTTGSLNIYDNSLKYFRDNLNLTNLRNINKKCKSVNGCNNERVSILDSYKCIALKGGNNKNKNKNKKINKMLALHSLYIINKNRQKKLKTCHNHGDNNNGDNNNGDNNGDNNFIIEKVDMGKMQNDKDDIFPFLITTKKYMNYYLVDLTCMCIFLNYLINYDYLFLTKFETFNCLTKLYIDLLRKTNLKEIHFLYLFRIFEINRKLNIYNNFLTKLLYSSIYFKCKKIIDMNTNKYDYNKTRYVNNFNNTNLFFSKLYEQHTCNYLVKSYIELLKSKNIDIKLFNCINKCLSIFLENKTNLSTNYITLYKCLKLLYLINENVILGMRRRDIFKDEQNYIFYVITNLENIKWDTLNNEYVLKYFKYINNLTKNKKKKKIYNLNFCKKNWIKIEKINQKLCLTINKRICNLNLIEIIKLYLYSNYNFGKKKINLDNLFKNILQYSNIINEQIQDEYFFISIFKITIFKICLNFQEYKNKNKLVDNINKYPDWTLILNLLILIKKQIKNNVNQIKKKNIYLMLTQLFFCLSIIFKQNIWVYKNWRKVNLCAKNWRKISKPNNIEIVENLYEIINIIFKKGWVCNNDDKNFLIYIYLLYFNRMIIKKKEIKIKFFKKKEGKEFLQITQNYINEMNKILNNPLVNSNIAYTNSLLLFFLFKYKIFLINYKNRKNKNKMCLSINNSILYRNLLNYKNDYKLFQILFFTIIYNYNILNNYNFTFIYTPWNYLYNNSILETQQHSTFSFENKYLRNNFYDPIPNKKYTLYYNLNDWNNLATILQKNYRSTNILYLFICRKKEIEHSLKLASFRASNLGPPFCRL
ncbi:hypothetical protein YYC_05206 [Plasmodium yoelii 17X]|uniref:Uncharacterized protein n=1 Tax=Plasmodium yoelii 17X TaxID=1323249 RepID=V7PDJ5_PLAYE|nr:hypothetical protein YYC_05206 [Plasmodium yoelii 17X]